VLATWIGRALPSRLGNTVWFYVAAVAAVVSGMGLGLWLAGGVAGSADAYRAMRLAHVHLNVLGWIGLAVVGTQFTLWPTVLRTRMMPGLDRAVGWSLPPLVVGLAVVVAGLLTQRRVVALAGLAGYTVGLAFAVGLFVRTARGTAHGVLDGAGMLVHGRGRGRPCRRRQPRVVDLDGRVARLVPAWPPGCVADADRGAHLPAAGGVRPGRSRQPPAPVSSSWAGSRGRRQPRGAGAGPGPSGRVGAGDGWWLTASGWAVGRGGVGVLDRR
jgi:hypothetical protein